MTNIKVGNYTFAPGTSAFQAATLTLPDYSPVDITRLVRVYNVTRGRLIYDLSATTGNATATGTTVTFSGGPNTNKMSTTDKLEVVYDDPTVSSGGGGGGGGGTVTAAATGLPVKPGSDGFAVTAFPFDGTGLAVKAGSDGFVVSAPTGGLLIKAPTGGLAVANLTTVKDGDGTSDVTRIAGKDRNGIPRWMLTDDRGRQKISHAQPDLVSADLTTVNDALVFGMDSLSDAMFFMKGAAHAGYSLAFEYSPNTTAVSGKTPSTAQADGDWYPVYAKNVGAPTGAAATSTGTLTSNGLTSWELSSPAAASVRARVTALTSGTLTVGAAGSTAARPTQLTAVVSNTPNVSVTNTPTVQIGTTNVVAAYTRPVSGQQDETSTALAASATYGGTTRDLGATVNDRATRLRWTYAATAAALGSVAHLYLEESADGTSWRATQIMPIPADGGNHTGEWPIGHLRYYRLRVVNQATAQTALFLSGLQVRGDGSTADTRANLPFPLTPEAGTTFAASATLIGPNLDLYRNHQWDRIRLTVRNSDTAATTYTYSIQGSFDNSNFFALPNASVTTASATPSMHILEAPVAGFRYCRAILTNNSATAGAAVQIAAMALISL